MLKSLPILALAVSAFVAAAPLSAASLTEAVNAYRAAAGTAPLRQSSRLDAAAAAHAAELAKRNELSHYGRNGSKPSQRAARKGYDYCFMAENIAMAEVDTATVLRLWIDSPDHKKNFLHRKAREFGLGKSGKYWVMMLGSENC